MQQTAWQDIQIAIENSDENSDVRCENHAPFVCYQIAGGETWGLVQGCCNSWYCPRCSLIRAKHEYHRMRDGSKYLAEEKSLPLFFVTITCDGGELTEKQGDENYLFWTNKFLTNWRAKTKRESGAWCYVQVTERQKRGLAHSHLITSMIPSDAIPVTKGQQSFVGYTHRMSGLESYWLTRAAISSGLGAMVNISPIETPEAVASYVAKYLFKQLSFAAWPSKWKRIRYSHSWPKAKEIEGKGDAFPVIRASDWKRVQALKTVYAKDMTSYETSLAALCTNTLPPSPERMQRA